MAHRCWKKTSMRHIASMLRYVGWKKNSDVIWRIDVEKKNSDVNFPERFWEVHRCWPTSMYIDVPYNIAIFFSSYVKIATSMFWETKFLSALFLPSFIFFPKTHCYSMIVWDIDVDFLRRMRCCMAHRCASFCIDVPYKIAISFSSYVKKNIDAPYSIDVWDT